MLNEIGWLGRKPFREGGLPSRTLMGSPTENEGPTSEFMRLPPEIQQKIFLELPMPSVATCRQVCAAWCDLIDASLKFSFIFNDERNDYGEAEFPPWRISRCFIGSYVDDELEFLRHPDALRVLTIWGNITGSNFLRILGQTTKLEELNLANKALSLPDTLFELNGVPQQVNLRQLRKLTLYSKEPLSKFEKNLSGILRQNMPNLVKLKIIVEPSADFGDIPAGYYDIPNGVQVAANIAIFVSQQRQLKTIHLVMEPFISVNEDVVTRLVFQLNERHNLEENLGQLKLHNCRFKVSSFIIKLFGALFARQSNLKDIRLEVPSQHGMPLQFSSLETSIRSSMPTLVSIHLQWLPRLPAGTMNNGVLIDFSIFHTARNLKRITISRNCERRYQNQAGDGVIANLHHLPPSIEVLELSGFCYRSDELKMVAQSPNLSNLKFVRLVEVEWSQIGFGIDGSVARALCSKKSLHVLTIGPLKNRPSNIRNGEDPEFSGLRDVFNWSNFSLGEVVTVDFRRLRWERKRRALREGSKAMFGRKQSCSFNLLSTTL